MQDTGDSEVYQDLNSDRLEQQNVVEVEVCGETDVETVGMDVDDEGEVGDQTLAQNTTLVESEVSRIFGKGASGLSFEPVQSSTPSRDEFKRNASIGSDGCLESDLDSSKKLRLELSPSKGKPPTEPKEDKTATVDDSGGGMVLLSHCEVDSNVVTSVEESGGIEGGTQPDIAPEKAEEVNLDNLGSSHQDNLVMSEGGIPDQVS